MKTIYVLYNDDICEIIAASYDKQLLEEMICDFFFEDLYSEYCWEHNYNIYETPATFEELWDDTLEFYNDYVFIKEVNIIE